MKAFVCTGYGKAEDVLKLDFLRQRAEAGDFKAVIDRIYLFSDMVAAHNHVDSGRKRGNVVVTT